MVAQCNEMRSRIQAWRYGMKRRNSGKLANSICHAVRSMAVCCAMALLCNASLVADVFAVDGAILWQHGDNVPGRQDARASAVDSQGNVIITGHQNNSGNDDYWTAKFAADGSGVSWSASFDKAGGDDQATTVAVDHNDDVIVTGYAWNGSNRDIHTIKYSGGDGTVIWQHTFNGSANGHDIATAIAVDSLNNVYVGGSSQSASGTDDYIILKYAATGPVGNAPAWQASYNGPANNMDNLYSLGVGTDSIAVTGQSSNGTTFDLLTAKYDLNGSKLWEKRYASVVGAMGKKVRVDNSGNVFVTGFAADATSKNIHTVKYRGSDGVPVWERSSATSFDEEGNDLFVDNSGEVFVTGYVYTVNGTKKRAYTARYGGANGSVVWESISGMASDSDESIGIVVDSVGDVFIAGQTIASSNYDFMTIKYKRATGVELWNHRFNGSMNLNDRPVGIGLAPDGGVLVAGWSDSGANDYDYFAMKLDPQYLSAPSNLAATTVSNAGIRLTWTDNADTENGYKIERKIGANGDYAQVAQLSTPNTTSYDDLGLSGNITYYYRVRAYNVANGDSRYSNEAHALTVYFNSVSPAWTYLYNSPDNQNDKINALAVGPDNNPVVTGYSQKIAGGHDFMTIKLDRANKNVLWSQPYDDPNGGTDEAMCVAVDSGGNTVVSGFATLYNPVSHTDIFSIYTLMYSFIDPSSVSWDSQYNGPGNLDDRPVAIASATDTSNNTVVVGYGKNASNNTDIYVIKYNSASGKVWDAVPYDGPGHGNDIPSSALFGLDGSIYVTGYSEKTPGSSNYSFFTAKYAGSDGSLTWSDVYSVAPTGDNKGNFIAMDNSGDVYITGSATNLAGNRDIYTIKYSGSAGTAQRLWERALDGPAHGDDAGVSVGVDQVEGNIVVAGTSLTSADNNDFSLVKYSSAGDVVWPQTLLRPNNDDNLKGMAVDPSGTIYLTGDTSNGASVDILSAILDPSGAVLATSVYNGPGNDADEPATIVANEKGEAFVGGYATNSGGTMDYLALKLLSTTYIIPVPTRLVAAAQTDSSKINLSWANNYSGAGFRIERTLGPVTAGSSWTLINTAAVGVTSYPDSGLLPATSYCYRIEAYSGSTTSRKTYPVCTTTTPSQPVLSPLAIISTTAIDLSWGNVSGNSGYKLERSTDNVSWAQIGANLSADTTVYHDTGLSAGTSYVYRVTALSNSGPSVTSAVQIAPALSSTVVSTSQIDLSWPAMSGITGYKLERSPNGSTGWAQIAAPVQSATSYQNTGLTAGTTYYYRIKAATAAGDSVPSFVTSAATYLATPVIQTLTADSTSQLTVTWSAVTGATGYTVQVNSCNYSTSNTSYCASYTWAFAGWTTVATNVAGTSYSITGLSAGYNYKVTVTATAPGSTSLQSAAMSRWTVLPVPITLSLSTPSSTSVRLDWNKLTAGAVNYTIQRSTDGSSWSDAGTMSYSINYFTDPSRTASTLYYYRVRGNGVEASVTSNQASITTPPGGPTLNAPTVVPPTEIDITWNRISGNTGYEVQRSVANNMNYPVSPTFSNWLDLGSTGQDVETFSNTGLTAGYTYGYRVRAILAGGAYTDWSTTTANYFATTTPPTPTGVYGVGQSATATLFYWGDVYGDNGYDTQYKIQSGGDCANGSWTAGPSATSNYGNANVTGLANNAANTYCFQVRAKINGLYSGWSASAVTLPPPAAPTFGAVTGSSIVVNWGQVAGNTGYRLDRSPDGTNWSQIVSSVPANTTTYTNTGLTADVLYYYRVKTLNGQNVSAGGASASTTTTTVSAPSLNAPSGVTSSSITLTWNDVGGNNGYRVQRSPDNVTFTTITPDIAPSVTTYTNTGLASGTTYYYRVYTKYGASSLSASPSNVQSAKTLLISPVMTSAVVISESRIDVTWQLATGATNYKLQRSIGPDGPWTQITNPSVAFAQKYCGLYATRSTNCNTLIPAYNTYANTGLTENTNYCYQVIAADSDPSHDSSPSAIVCGKTPAVGAPTLATVTNISAKKMTQLTWSYNPAACSPTPCELPDGYEIWRQAWSGEWGLVSKTGNSTYTDRVNIESLKTYNYKIRAYKGTDISVFSNIKGVTTPVFSLTDSTCP